MSNLLLYHSKMQITICVGDLPHQTAMMSIHTPGIKLFPNWLIIILCKDLTSLYQVYHYLHVHPFALQNWLTIAHR